MDDLAIISRKPQEIVDALEKDYGFKLKGTGPIAYHLGSDFFCDSEGVLCMAPKKYIDRMSEIYFRLLVQGLRLPAHPHLRRVTIRSWISVPS